ncbi:unnamed protein product [Dibothriocephalus latus]|uniref:Uncharacterized protein n=1 Tax=Dibothriocephalus latus TaxID=60516 RepID=A0A3P6TP95_DIBLA|nr:unnamed protein product [Dibothriocephalus latus]
MEGVVFVGVLETVKSVDVFVAVEFDVIAGMVHCFQRLPDMPIRTRKILHEFLPDRRVNLKALQGVLQGVLIALLMSSMLASTQRHPFSESCPDISASVFGGDSWGGNGSASELGLPCRLWRSGEQSRVALQCAAYIGHYFGSFDFGAINIDPWNLNINSGWRLIHEYRVICVDGMSEVGTIDGKEFHSPSHVLSYQDVERAIVREEHAVTL